MESACIPLLCLFIHALARVGADSIIGYEDPNKNLMRNWEFEDAPSDDADWFMTKAKGTIETGDSHTGSRSLRVSNRLLLSI